VPCKRDYILQKRPIILGLADLCKSGLGVWGGLDE